MYRYAVKYVERDSAWNFWAGTKTSSYPDNGTKMSGYPGNAASVSIAVSNVGLHRTQREKTDVEKLSSNVVSFILLRISQFKVITGSKWSHSEEYNAHHFVGKLRIYVLSVCRHSVVWSALNSVKNWLQNVLVLCAFHTWPTFDATSSSNCNQSTEPLSITVEVFAAGAITYEEGYGYLEAIVHWISALRGEGKIGAMLFIFNVEIKTSTDKEHCCLCLLQKL